jgi:6-phosphogluconolactonase
MRRIQGLCCLFLLGVTGCGGFFVAQTNSGGGTNTGDYIYVGNGNDTYIAGFGVSSSGALSVLSGSPYNNGVAAQSLAVTPANTFLYAGTTNGIYAYAINSNGSITVQNSGSAVAQDMVATQMRVDSTGGYLLASGFGTSIGAQAIGIYQINTSTGLLTAITGSPLPLYTGNASTPAVVTPTGVILDTTGSYVYVANKGSNNISAFTLTAASGKLTAVAGSPFASGGQLPTALVNDNSKKFVAVINSGANGSGGNSDMQVFSFDTTTDGKLNPVSTATTGTDPTNPQSIAASH